MAQVECKFDDNPVMKTFEVAINTSFLEIGARVLNPPRCEFSVYFKIFDFSINFCFRKVFVNLWELKLWKSLICMDNL